MKLYITTSDMRKASVELSAYPLEAERYCPIAQCLKRNNIEFDSVMRTSIFFVDGRMIDLPQNAIDFISDYDGGKKVNPISIEINL